MIKELSPSAVYMGLLAAFVGYTASFAIVLAGLTSMGASEAQAATGLFYATLGMGVCSIVLPAVTRVPAAVAWSTPGAAFMAASAALPGGFAEAVGALICCAVLILITGIVRPLGRLVAAIPKPVANALLAGVLFKLCLAPALAMGSIPGLILPVIGAWIVGLTWNKLAAMPLALLAFLVVFFVGVDMPDGAAMGQGGWRPDLGPLTPVFTLQGFVSVAIPLFLVTMAGQNIPGFAVLEMHGYEFRRQPLLRQTGLASLLIAPFGAIPMNMSAITAAMMSGEDAGRDPSRRYWAAIVSGLGYVVLAFLAGPVTALATLAPSELITGMAGLALIPALVGSLRGAFSDPAQTEAPALTFLITASGMVMWGISGAVWGVVAGVLLWLVKQAFRKG
ncbi:benzoate membrane transport protein [Roseovarius pacificus]|uniref:Benzoate membrane transport protein n=1 Tax=Roseovarius pacificus TaxID=337701 RepID=A0A1M7C3R9_9RHOB|nr:benzoate/H(+) symporter BenE family transporter [Roseovarius pacificus]GGO55860.1 benzoate transporter [Roseovarius pacificus]SHL61870.1 benzoate membrane transport protein [Roseovarius pacificus]